MSLPPLSAAAAAERYKSFPSALDASLSSQTERARMQEAERERSAQSSARVDAERKRATEERRRAMAQGAAAAFAGDSLSSADASTRPSDALLRALSAPRPHTAGGDSAALPLRLPTPLPSLRPSTRDDAAAAIDLPLPQPVQPAASGSQSARTWSSSSSFSQSNPSSSSSSALAAVGGGSSLGALTQATNARLAALLRHSHRRSDSSLAGNGGGDRSHRLLLASMAGSMSERELEEQRNISRVLTSWHPARSAKSFAALSAKIRGIVSERLASTTGGRSGGGGEGSAGEKSSSSSSSSDRAPSWSGKTLEDGSLVGEDLDKKGRVSCFRVALSPSVSSVRVELDVTEGRVECFLCVGDPLVTPANYARERERTWTIRNAGPGHHALHVPYHAQLADRERRERERERGEHGSRADREREREGPDYCYVSIHALQASSILIKATPAHRRDQSDSSALNSPRRPSSASSELSARIGEEHAAAGSLTGGGLASSSSGGGGGAGSGALSHRNLRRKIEARLETLRSNPQALREFQRKVAGLRRGMGVSHDRSRLADVHPPAHLSLAALQALNERAAANMAAEVARMRNGGVLPSPSLLSSNPASPSARSSSPRREEKQASGSASRDASPSTRFHFPLPLTAHALNFVPLIHSIPGLGALFVHTARELRNPRVLDDSDRILPEQVLPPAGGVPRRPSNRSVSPAPSAATTVTATGSSPGSSPIPSPQASPRAVDANFLSAPSSPSASSFAPPPPVEGGRRLTLSETLTALVVRVVRRLRLRAQQLESERAQGLPPPPPIPESDPDYARLPQLALSEPAAFLRRGAAVFEAHRAEVEAVLRALVHPGSGSGGGALVRMSAALEAGQQPPRNFLLSNALDSTELRSHDAQLAAARRERRAREHAEKMAEADHRRRMAEEERRNSTLASIERKERERMEAKAEREAVAAKLALQQLQRAWLRHIASALRQQWLLHARANLHPMRVESFRKSHAARRIQVFVRSALALKRSTRAALHLQTFRSVMLLLAANFGAVKRDRAANLLKRVLEAKSGVDSVSRVMKNFRRRVAICQRAVRNFLATRAAKLVAWRLQYERFVRAGHAANHLLLLSDTATRDSVLADLFERLQRGVVESWPAYLDSLHAYHARLSEERSKQSVLPDHVMQLLAFPRRPRVPVRLDEATLSAAVERALQINREQALRNLHSTTAAVSMLEATSSPQANLPPLAHPLAHAHTSPHGTPQRARPPKSSRARRAGVAGGEHHLDPRPPLMRAGTGSSSGSASGTHTPHQRRSRQGSISKLG